MNRDSAARTNFAVRQVLPAMRATLNRASAAYTVPRIHLARTSYDLVETNPKKSYPGRMASQVNSTCTSTSPS